MRLLHVAALGLVLACGLAAVARAAPAPADEADPSVPTLRVASAYDPQTMDPHSIALVYNTRVVFSIYEGLVGRDEGFHLEPALATSWRALNPTTWRFHLRPDVLFHDGSPFTADDAVFSFERALASPSQRAFTLKGLIGARKVDALTIDLLLSSPDAVLPEKLQLVAMMSRAWAKSHGVERAQDFNAGQETFAVRNANGTGPFRLERYEPDTRTTLRAHRQWWGRADPRNGNVDRLSFLTIRSDATRLAALAAGEVDLVLDPPFQDVAHLQADPRFSVSRIPDLGVQVLALDQWHDQLPGTDPAATGGRNPFKDVRVRRAIYHAINLDLIVEKVLRGQAVPTGSLLAPTVEGNLPEFESRLRFDPAEARRLLAEAGYGKGFDLTLECVNVSTRQQVCQAIAAMLTRVGLPTRVHAAPMTQLVEMVTRSTAGFVEYGWSSTPDPWAGFNGLLHSRDGAGGGVYNAGRYANPKLDAIIDELRAETDLTRRRALVTVAMRLVRDEVPCIPLYRRQLSWAMHRGVRVRMWPDDTLPVRWVSVR